MTPQEKLSYERRLSLFMFITLTKAASDWTSWIDTVTARETKHWFSVYKNAGAKVKKLLEGALGEHYANFEEDAFIWGDMLDHIRKADAPEKKEECLHIIKEYLAGNVKTLEDSGSLPLVEAGMSEHACKMLLNHEILTVGDLKNYIKTNGHAEFGKLKGIGGAVLLESIGVLSKYF